MEKLTPKKRVMNVLNGQKVDKVPFTVYSGYWGGNANVENPTPPFVRNLLQCETERKLRNKGLCLVELGYFGWGSARPDVRVVSTVYNENEKHVIRTDYKTPYGNLYSIKEVNDFTVWSRVKLFKTKEDYKKILFILENTVVFEVNNAIEKAIRMLGDDVVLRGDFGYEPLQEFISGDFFSTEQFCIEWMDNRDEILKLYNANVEIKRKAYKIAAKSPIDIIIYGGNVTPAVISPKNFEDYYLPHYEEACEVLKPKGKIVGCHFDANLSLLKNLIAKTSLDIIEAFTPYPDTDMTSAEAKKTWPDKVLWINFPSSVHIESIEKIKTVTKNLIKSVDGEKLIIGITEDVPENRWQGNYMAIMEAIDEYYGV